MPGRKIRIGYALCQQGQGGTHAYRIPAVTRAKDGSLLAFYDMRHNRTKDLQEDIDIGLSKSTDGGQTWSEPRPIMDRGEWEAFLRTRMVLVTQASLLTPRRARFLSGRFGCMESQENTNGMVMEVRLDMKLERPHRCC